MKKKEKSVKVTKKSKPKSIRLVIQDGQLGSTSKITGDSNNG